MRPHTATELLSRIAIFAVVAGLLLAIEWGFMDAVSRTMGPVGIEGER